MRGTKIINYSTPKHVQLRLKQNKPFTASKKTKRYCIKTKGSHKFSLTEKEKSIIFNEWFITYKCNHCGKKKLKIEPETSTLRAYEIIKEKFHYLVVTK